MIRIRTAKKEDIEQIFSLAKEVHKMVQQERSKFLGNIREFSSQPKDYLKIIQSKDGIIFVAEEECIVGYIYATIERKPDDLIAIPHVSVNEIAVKKEARNSGIGKLLIKQIEDYAYKKGMRVVQLATWEFNRNAIEFFKKLGYNTIMRKMEKVLE